MNNKVLEMKQLVKEECESIIRIGGEITHIETKEDLSVEIHFKDHNCDAIGGFYKVKVVEFPKEKIQNEIKFCPQCGNKVEKEHKFCPQCGTQIKEKVVIPKEVLLDKIGQINGIDVIGNKIMIPRYQEEIIEELIKLGKKTGHIIEEDLSLGSTTVLICKD